MATPEAVNQFDRNRELQAKVIREGMAAVERYLAGIGRPVEIDPDYLMAVSEWTNARQAPGYQAYGESLD